MSTYQPDTNFIGKDGEDLGKVLVTKDYLLSVYPQLSQELLGTTPELWTWGLGNSGQLGTNNTSNRSTPVTTFAGGTDWKQVSSGNAHTAAIKTDGTLWTWGSGSYGRLGTNDTTARSTPVTTFVGGTDWKQVSSGYRHTAAIKTDGTLWTWGLGTSGQLGTNNASNRSTPVTTFAGGTNWKQVSAGREHTAAIKTDGTLWTWGLGTSGRLGDNNAIRRSTPVTTFAGGTNWKQVSSGGYHTAAIKTDGTLWTWGAGADGRLGDNNTISRSTPVTTFAGGTNWKQVSTGRDHTAAIKTDGTLWTWGDENYGQLGRVFSSNSLTPVTTFAGGTNWADTATGAAEELYTIGNAYYSSAAIKTDGTLWVWGNNGGYLGINDEINRYTPVTTFAGGTDWKQISISVFYTCMAGVKTDGTLWLWGENNNGRLGTNDTEDKLTPVTTFAGGTDWKQVGSNDFHTAAIKTDGTLWTWGRGLNGRLGTNDTTDRSTPVTTFAGGTDWKHVGQGGYAFSTAIKTDGTLWTWGLGTNGQLGTNDTTQRNTPVTTFAGGTDWKQVSSGTGHTSAIKTDGTLWTWGYNNNGELGTNDTTSRSTPVTTFAGGTNWKQVSSGSNHTAAIKTDGTLWTWGFGGFGQLGTNDEITKSTPVTTFAGGTNWKQVSSGTSSTIALKDDGVNKEIYLFGRNVSGELGFDSYAINYIPENTFAGGTNWKQVSSGLSHTAAIKTDGTLWTWGLGTYGRLGDNNATNRFTPVTTFAGGSSWKQVSSGGFHTTAIQSQDII